MAICTQKVGTRDLQDYSHKTTRKCMRSTLISAVCLIMVFIWIRNDFDRLSVLRLDPAKVRTSEHPESTSCQDLFFGSELSKLRVGYQ